MMFKNKFLLLIIFLVIIFQLSLYTNNNQTAKFRYLKWTFEEVSIGKLISISFFSGLFISTFLNTTIVGHKKIISENIDGNYEPINHEEDIMSNIEMPPQRDIRDAQPTISVNYRVVKNMEEDNLKRDQNYSKNPDNQDDWDNVDNDW